MKFFFFFVKKKIIKSALILTFVVNEMNVIIKLKFIFFQLLEELLKFLTQGRTCLAFPKRKSIEELIRNHNMVRFSQFEPPRGKTNNVVSEQVRHKLACTATEKS